MQIQLKQTLLIVMALVITFSGCDRAQRSVMIPEDTPDVSQAAPLTIMGGPPGGSFSPFAMAISDVVVQEPPHPRLIIETSAGSVENTRRVNDTPNSLGIAFASESYLGYHGQGVFTEEGPKANLRAVTLLYIAYSQTFVLTDSDIHQFSDFVGKKIATGRVGSGSAKTLERLTQAAGIWEQIMPVYAGPQESTEALRDGEAEVFHQLVSIPNNAVVALTEAKAVRPIDMDAPAQASGFYEKYPFYQSGTIPEGSYGGKVNSVDTLLMPTLLLAHQEVSAEVVYAILKQIYTPEGLQSLITATGGSAEAMTLENAPKGFVIPLHEGAYQFWSEHDVEIPGHAMPVN